jgi:hypothetical protein
MASEVIADLGKLDREVARANAALEKWRARIAKNPDANEGDDPLEPFRHVAGQTTYGELLALTPMAHDVPLRDGLVRWIAALVQARLARELDVAWARAASDARGRFRGEPPRMVSWRDAWRGIVPSTSRAEQALWLDAAVDCAPRLSAVARERAARRFEIAQRLATTPGASPAKADDATTTKPALRPETLSAAARALLTRTDDLAAAVLREKREHKGDPSPLDALRVAVARDAPEGWPARSMTRWLEELFGEGVRGLSIDLARLPEPLGASSFMRALGAFGFSFRVAAAPRSLPFVLARDPQPVSAHRFAFVFASLAASPEFHRVALGVGRRAALGQARILARTALLDARLGAARILLDGHGETNAGPIAPPDLFEELTTRVLGAPMPSALAAAWLAPRDDEPARFAALLTALPLASSMVAHFDVDWFRNPRAMPHLRAVAAVPAHESDLSVDVDASASLLARVFEEALA